MKIFRILLVVSMVSLTAAPVFAQTWTQTSAPSTNWVSITSSADGTRLVAACNLGGIWISTDSGNTWMQTSAPLSGWIGVASSADGTRLAAIGVPPPLLGIRSFYASTNSGQTWISNDLPSVAKVGASWRSLVSSADGCKLMALNSGGLFTSTDLGATWITNNLPNLLNPAWNSIAASADGTKLMVAGIDIAVSTNSGDSWILTNSLSLGASFVASSADGCKWVAIGGQRIFVSTNLGMTWLPTGAPATNWNAVAASADASTLVAVAGRRSLIIRNPSFEGPIYTSMDAGVTWTSNSVPAQYWDCVACSADGRKIFAATAGDISIYGPGATVGGGIWTAQTTPAPQLNLTPSGGNLTAYWIVPSTNFVLQQSLDLTSWADVTDTPVLNLTNLQDEVVLSPTNNNGFYRLKTP